MMHTKFQGHPPFGSGEEDFLRFLPYMGMATGTVVSEEKMFKECGGRTTEAYYPISTPNQPSAQVS